MATLGFREAPKNVWFLFQKRDASFWSEKKYKCHLVSFVRFMFFQFKKEATKRRIKIAFQVTKHCKCHRTCCRCYQATRLMNYQSWANDFNATPAGNKTLRPYLRTLVVPSLIRPYFLGGSGIAGGALRFPRYLISKAHFFVTFWSWISWKIKLIQLASGTIPGVWLSWRQRL